MIRCMGGLIHSLTMFYISDQHPLHKRDNLFVIKINSRCVSLKQEIKKG